MVHQLILRLNASIASRLTRFDTFLPELHRIA